MRAPEARVGTSGSSAKMGKDGKIKISKKKEKSVRAHSHLLPV